MPPKKEPKEQPACSICCSILNKSKNKPILCNFCSQEACLECVKHYLLDTHGDLHCMFCRNKWNRDILVEKLPQVFIKEELRESQEKKIVEMEKARLPAAQTVAENRIKLKNIEMFREAVQRMCASQEVSTIGETNNSRLELMQLIAKNYGIEDDIKIDGTMNMVFTNLEAKVKAEDTKKNYVRNCPNNSCRGFISEEWNCSLCQTKMCKKCYEKEEDEHKCDPNIIESNKLIAKDSKPCPKCGSMITKLSGCFAKDTPILLWDRSIKKVQDIVIGDEVIGDDASKRVIQNVCSGKDRLFRISQEFTENKQFNGATYIVNSKHNLVLYDKVDDKVITKTVDEYLELTNEVKNRLYGYRYGNTFVDRILLMQKLTVEEVGYGDYYGFMINGNHRFFLPDYTVVSNCDQMWCTTCHTAFSWERGTIEKGHIHNPHFYQWQKTISGNTPQTVQNTVNMCDDNYFPTYSNLLLNQNKFDSYVEKWLPVFHQFILHIYSVVRPVYLETARNDLKMEININYMMTAFGKTEWKRQLYEADRKQELARDVVELIDMMYMIAGERFRNFIRDNKSQHIKDVESLIIYTMSEVEKIKKRHMTKNVIISEPGWYKTIKTI